MILKLIKIRLSAGILPLVLSISIILSLFCGIAIMFSYYKNLLWIKIETLNRLETNVESALEYSMALGLDNINQEIPFCIDLFGEGRDTVKILKKAWGIFDWISIEAINGRSKCAKNVLVGYSSQISNNMGLYVSNTSPDPLIMVGNSKIIGDAWLPSRGIRTGYLNKQGFIGSDLINGTVYKSDLNIPKIKDEIFGKVEKMNTIHKSELNTDMLSSEVVQNNFSNPMLTFHSDKTVNLKNNIGGHIIIASDTEIIVHATANLENIIIVAPIIKFESGCNVCLQAFASQQIIIESRVCLNYPSSIVLSNQEEGSIEIAGGSIVEGLVLLINNNKSLNSSNGGLIYLFNGSIINGQVISTSKVEHHGTVNGQIVCKSLCVQSNSGEYINYLSEGNISRNSLSNFFLFPGIFENEVLNPDILINLN